MDAIQDFEDILALFDLQHVEYLIVGGLAFIYHAKPRYTKDMDLWINPLPENVAHANKALAEFGSPFLLDPDKPNQIVQLGVAPNRIDLLLDVGEIQFESAWDKRIVGMYGDSKANWIDLDSLIQIKQRINKPKHKEDVRVLLKVKSLQEKRNTK